MGVLGEEQRLKPAVLECRTQLRRADSSSVTNVRTPNCMLAPIVLWLQDLHDDTAGRELGQSRIDQQT